MSVMQLAEALQAADRTPFITWPCMAAEGDEDSFRQSFGTHGAKTCLINVDAFPVGPNCPTLLGPSYGRISAGLHDLQVLIVQFPGTFQCGSSSCKELSDFERVPMLPIEQDQHLLTSICDHLPEGLGMGVRANCAIKEPL